MLFIVLSSLNLSIVHSLFSYLLFTWHVSTKVRTVPQFCCTCVHCMTIKTLIVVDVEITNCPRRGSLNLNMDDTRLKVQRYDFLLILTKFVWRIWNVVTRTILSWRSFCFFWTFFPGRSGPTGCWSCPRCPYRSLMRWNLTTSSTDCTLSGLRGQWKRKCIAGSVWWWLWRSVFWPWRGWKSENPESTWRFSFTVNLIQMDQLKWVSLYH